MKENNFGARQFPNCEARVFDSITHLSVKDMLSVMTNCAREFNIESDVLKYQKVISVLQRIKVEFWDRKGINDFFRLVGQERPLQRDDIYAEI